MPARNRRSTTSLFMMALFLSGCLSSDQADPTGANASGAYTSAAADQSASLSTTRSSSVPTWKLVDLDDASTGDVEAMLGQPAFVRADPPALYWRFGDATCALDVYLYAGDDGSMRVKHTELRRQTGVTAATTCLDHLRRTLVADTTDDDAS